ncbi:MAG: alpha/beta fold hydrolase [Mariprofundaceae bacterium]|nr:alpha/beta fold hydrolase [Mariprofundaceae bacterium]
MLPVLVFIHGWGQSPQSWQAQRDYFSTRCETKMLCLPGHGGAADAPCDAWADNLRQQLPDAPHILIGWSLGGMLALQLARQEAVQLRGLVLLSATPCFRMRADWPHGCSNALFRGFQDSVEEDNLGETAHGKDSERLLGRFFALMLQGDAVDRRRYLDIVRRAMDRKNTPTSAGLKAGLSLLGDLDLRAILAEITLPTLIVHGTGDSIVPLGAARFLDRALPYATLRTLPAGHALHLTQAKKFNQILEAWCLDSISIRSV